LTRIHQYVSSLKHYSLISQTFKPDHSRRPGPEADGELPVDGFIKATSAPPLPARQ
jgi:hypothetical protein